MRVRTTMRWAVESIVLLFFIILAQEVWADGIKIPAVSVRKLPAIPYQCAVISYRDGTEKLLIDSSIDGEGNTFAWIVPVPSKPTAFAEAKPELSENLSSLLEPRIGSLKNVKIILGAVCLWAFLVLFWAFAALNYQAQPHRVMVVICAVMSPFISSCVAISILSLSGWFLSMTLSKAVERPDVAVEHSQRIGNYDLAVLAVQNADALNAWLRDNGFKEIPSEGNPIVDDYASRDWRFVAAKLRRDGSGYSRPHPIILNFSTPQPIYPMRLTRLADSNLYLEMFVIAEKRAKVGILDMEVCMTYSRGMSSFIPSSGSAWLDEAIYGDLMWDGCVVTKLAGALKPKDMKSDINITFKPAREYVRTLYSKADAGALAFFCGCLFFSLIMPAFIFIYLGNVTRAPGQKAPGIILTAKETLGNWVLLVGSALLTLMLSAALFALLAVFLCLILGPEYLLPGSLVYFLGVPIAVFCWWWRRPHERRTKSVLRWGYKYIILPTLGAGIVLGLLAYTLIPKTELETKVYSEGTWRDSPDWNEIDLGGEVPIVELRHFNEH